MARTSVVSSSTTDRSSRVTDTRVNLRREDQRLLTGAGTFIDNQRFEGFAHVVFCRSILSHAEITSIEVDDAQDAQGVLGVLTAETLGLEALAPEYVGLGVEAEMLRWPLARDRVRFVGEPVAAVVATTRQAAVDAAELVEIDYEMLDPVVTVENAMLDDVLLFPEAGTNQAFDLYEEPSTDLFADCEVVVRQRLRNQRLAPCPLEVRASAAIWGDDGRLTQWVASQTPHNARTQLSMAHGIDEDAIRVITPDVGGGFGAKIGIGVEELMLGQLAKLVGQPVRWVETRSESMMAMGHGRAQDQLIEIGGSRDGTIGAYRLTIAADCGAYPRMGAILASMTGLMASGVYDIDRVEVVGASYVTNTCPVVAYRGAGRPEATAAIERAVDLFAAEVEIDSALVRDRNLIPADAFPHDTPTGATYDSGDYPEALRRLCKELDLGALRVEQQARRDGGDTTRLGIGLSTYVEITAPLIDSEWADVEVTSDGRVIGSVGTTAQGQGHETTFATLIADRLGVAAHLVEIRLGDTDEIPRGEGTMGSRSMQIGGAALADATELVIEKAREAAAHILEAAVADVVLNVSKGHFHVAGSPAISLTWAAVAGGLPADERLNAELVFDPEGSTFPFGAHAAVVEVDIETGAVELVRMVAIDDAGTILNPVLAEGQIHGGLAQGVAQALFEEFTYDEDGNPTTANFLAYAIPAASELPAFEAHSMQTPTPLNALGAKGIGESGTIGSVPAVQNAVIDALADLGVRHIDLPLSPRRVWRSLQC